MTRDEAAEIALLAVGPKRVNDLTPGRITAWQIALENADYEEARQAAFELTPQQRAKVNHRSFGVMLRDWKAENRRQQQLAMFAGRGLRPGDRSHRRVALATPDQARAAIDEIRARHLGSPAVNDPRRPLLARLADLIAGLADRRTAAR